MKYLVPIDMPVQLKGIALGALFLIVSFLFFVLVHYFWFFLFKNFMHFGGNAKNKGGTSIFSLVRQLP
jgi:hypothetical protein